MRDKDSRIAVLSTWFLHLFFFFFSKLKQMLAFLVACILSCMHSLGWRGPEPGLQLPILQGRLVPFKPVGTEFSAPNSSSYVVCPGRKLAQIKVA